MCSIARGFRPSHVSMLKDSSAADGDVSHRDARKTASAVTLLSLAARQSFAMSLSTFTTLPFSKRMMVSMSITGTFR